MERLRRELHREFAGSNRANLAMSNRLDRVLFEMRIDYGPGYRVYFIWRSSTVILLLSAGDKRSQARDIKRAHELAANLED